MRSCPQDCAQGAAAWPGGFPRVLGREAAAARWLLQPVTSRATQPPAPPTRAAAGRGGGARGHVDPSARKQVGAASNRAGVQRLRARWERGPELRLDRQRAAEVAPPLLHSGSPGAGSPSQGWLPPLPCQGELLHM